MRLTGKAYFSEFLGTFTLVFAGAGSVLANGLNGGSAGLVGIALAHGFALTAIIYSLGHLSGAHVNPAITIAQWITRRMAAGTAAGYLIAQLLGAAFAGFALVTLFPANLAALHAGVPSLAAGVGVADGVLLETVLTFFLALAVYGAAIDKRASPGIHGVAIGLTLAFAILVGGPLTGAALNPARAFGPALASGYWTNQAVYWAGPIIGAVLAALVYEYAFLRKRAPPKQRR